MKFICIFFVPRSSSTFLCRSMAAAGLGNPAEYFVPVSVRMIQEKYPEFSKSNPSPFIDPGSRNGIFSYKWNSALGMDPPPAIEPDLSLFIDRADRHAQAKSFYWAAVLKDNSKSYKDREDPPKNSMYHMLRHCDFIRRDTRAMMDRHTSNILELEFNEVTKDIDSVIEKIRGMI